MSDYIAGDEVFFRYNEVLTCVSGEVEEIIENPEQKLYAKIKWKNFGEGTSLIPIEDVFKTRAECEKLDKKVKNQKIEEIKNELKDTEDIICLAIKKLIAHSEYAVVKAIMLKHEELKKEGK